MNIGEKIKILRKEKNMTQKQLADAIHKSEVSIKKYEAGDTALTFDVLSDILDALDVSFEIQENDSNLLRKYIESKDKNINEEIINEIEFFVSEYIDFKINKQI